MNLLDVLNSLDPEVKWKYENGNLEAVNVPDINVYMNKCIPWHLWKFFDYYENNLYLCPKDLCLDLTIENFYNEPLVPFTEFKDGYDELCNVFKTQETKIVGTKCMFVSKEKIDLKDYPQELIELIKIEGNTIDVRHMYYFYQYEDEIFPQWKPPEHVILRKLIRYLTYPPWDKEKYIEWKICQKRIELYAIDGAKFNTYYDNDREFFDFLSDMKRILHITNIYALSITNPLEVYEELYLNFRCPILVKEHLQLFLIPELICIITGYLI